MISLIIILIPSHPLIYIIKLTIPFFLYADFFAVIIFVYIYVCNVPQTTTWMNVSCAYIINLTTCDRINIIWNCILSIMIIVLLCEILDWPTCYALMYNSLIVQHCKRRSLQISLKIKKLNTL